MRELWFNYGESITSIELYENLPKEEQEVLDRFKDYSLITASKDRAEEGVREVLRFKKITGKLLDADLEDLRYFLKELKRSSFADYTKNKVKNYIQRFLKWKFKDWSVRFNEFEDIKINGDAQNKKPITSKTLFTPEQVELLVEKEPSLYWKTFYSVQYEGGLRTKETRTLEWSNVSFEDDGFTTLSIPSKKNKNGTIKVNPVIIKTSGNFLKRLKEEQEKYGIKTKYVFPSPSNPNQYISKTGNIRFKKLCKEVLGREGNNYLLRHSKGTELQKKIREGTLSKDNAVEFMRHSQKMFDKVYSHMDKEDIKHLMKKQIYNTKELTSKEKSEISKMKERMDNMEKEMNVVKKRLLVQCAINSISNKYQKGEISGKEFKELGEQVKILIKQGGLDDFYQV